LSVHRTPVDFGLTPAMSRRAKSKRQRQHALYILLFALVTIVCLAMTTGLSTFTAFFGSSDSASPISNLQERRTGTIIRQRDENKCRRMKFDNDTGRTVEDFESCDNEAVLDAQGVPVPQGTLHRLDAISKSFSGR
jgi:hypothetical protein